MKRESSLRVGVMSFAPETKRVPSNDSLGKYFDYLSRGNTLPSQIIEASKRGEKAVLVEMIQTGQGFASFLSVWMRGLSAQESQDLLSSITFHAFDTNPMINEEVIEFDKDGERQAVSLHRRYLSAIEAGIMENTAPLNVCGNESSRLVSMYKLAANHEGEEGEGLILCRNKRVTREIRNTLHASVQAKELEFSKK